MVGWLLPGYLMQERVHLFLCQKRKKKSLRVENQLEQLFKIQKSRNCGARKERKELGDAAHGVSTVCRKRIK